MNNDAIYKDTLESIAKEIAQAVEAVLPPESSVFITAQKVGDTTWRREKYSRIESQSDTNGSTDDVYEQVTKIIARYEHFVSFDLELEPSFWPNLYVHKVPSKLHMQLGENEVEFKFKFAWPQSPYVKSSTRYAQKESA